MRADTDLLEPVLAIWREVLDEGHTALRADSNFFLCGGDSLDLTRVLMRVRERLGAELDIRQVARFSTPRRMARCIAAGTGAGDAKQSSIRTRPSDLAQEVAADPVTDTRYACSAGQRALWLAEQLSDGSGLYNSAFVLHFTGDLEVPVLARALSLLLQRHEVLRSRFEVDLNTQQLSCLIQARAEVLLDPAVCAPESTAHYLREVAAQPFDLGRGPLWRFRLLTAGTGHWTLLVCLHHSVTDGWSGGVLLNHLAESYNALLRNPQWKPPLYDREFRFWCGRQQAAPVAELHWWRRYLDGADRLDSWPGTGALRWPFRMAYEALVLDAGLVATVRQASRELRVRQSALFLAALRLALFEVGGVDELCIGMPVNVRDRAIQDESVGYFVNLVVTRTRVETGSRVTTVRRVQHELAEALHHRATSFAALVEHCRPAVCASGNPWCDVLFAFQNLPRPRGAFTGLHTDVEVLPLPLGQHPLKVEVVSAPGTYVCRVEYASECLSPRDARQLLMSLQAQLAALAADAA